MGRISLKSKTLIFCVLVIYMAIVVTYYGYYKNTIGIIESEYEAKIDLVEQSIFSETRYTEIFGKIIEKELERNMEDVSRQMIDLYRENPAVMDWDLEKMKDEFGKMDIYIIDEDLNIIASTVEEELGFSFSVYPSFSKTLKSRLAGRVFRSDSINFSFFERELKKYSYMPTPDNKYLIELSVNIKDRYPEIAYLDIFYLSNSLQAKYPFIENISVYRFDVNTRKSQIVLRDKEVLTAGKNLGENHTLMERALTTIMPQEEVIETDGDSYLVKYIPYYLMDSKLRLNWWGTYVIETIYTKSNLTEAVNKQKRIFRQSMVLLSLLYFSFLFAVIYNIKKNREMAYTDCLTKLPNRIRLEEYMKARVIEAKKKETKIAVFFFDLDTFKRINDSLGHSVGDRVLQKVAKKIKAQLPKRGIVCRLGGDEFVAAVPDLVEDKEIQAYADKMTSIFEKEFKIEGKKISVSSSIGVSVYPDSDTDVEKLISKADAAMYYAKQNKLGCVMDSNIQPVS